MSDGYDARQLGWVDTDTGELTIPLEELEASIWEGDLEVTAPLFYRETWIDRLFHRIQVGCRG